MAALNGVYRKSGENTPLSPVELKKIGSILMINNNQCIIQLSNLGWDLQIGNKVYISSPGELKALFFYWKQTGQNVEQKIKDSCPSPRTCEFALLLWKNFKSGKL